MHLPPAQGRGPDRARRPGRRLRAAAPADRRPAPRRRLGPLGLLRNVRAADALPTARRRAGPEHQCRVRRRPRLRRQGAPAPLDHPSQTEESPVYQVSSPTAVLRGHRRLLSRGRTGSRVNRTVVLLGLTSLFTDISSEMVVDGAAALPRLRRQLLAARLRGDRRALQRRDGDRAARQRLHRRPLAAPQGGRGHGLRALRHLQAAAASPSGPRCPRSARSCCSTARARASAPRRATR